MRRHQSIVTFAVAVVLVAVVATGGIFLWRMYAKPAPVDIREVGGTVLVYEVDRAEPLDAPTMEQMVEKSRRRFSGRMGYVTIQPAGDRRIEIQVPWMKKLDHATEVESVRSIMAMTGKLDFRIVANWDDRPALEAAQEMYSEPAVKERAKLLALKGSPPEPPRHPTNPKGFLCLPNDSEHANYTWFRVGREALQQFSLENGANDALNPDAESDATKLKQAREKGEPVLIRGSLVYGRNCTNANLTATERDQIKREHFLLCRDHVQMKSDEPNTLDGSQLKDAYASTDNRGGPCVYFSFSKSGGDMFYDLTSRNCSTDEAQRYLAVILDGIIVTAPRVLNGIRENGQITGRFTQKEVDSMAAVLRAGCLPAPLKPVPVTESVIQPASKPGQP